MGTFQPDFDKNLLFLSTLSVIYRLMSKNIKNSRFIRGVDFEFIQSLSNKGTKYLLIFDDSWEEISSSKDFVRIATAGRHKGLSAIYINIIFFIRVGWEEILNYKILI